MSRPARILIIAGSDSSGGAGIQADIKTVSLLGGYAMSAITAITAQNTTGVDAVENLSENMIRKQIRSCLTDIAADAIKIGMLPTGELIEAVASELAEVDAPIILDPVMVATSGDRLQDDAAKDTMIRQLFPLATLITPNLPEAAMLSGKPDPQTMLPILHDLGAKAVLLKGGHGETDKLQDIISDANGQEILTSARIDTTDTHGTGCTLASAIATYIGQGHAMRDAVKHARDYVRKAIETAPGFGRGHGPINHLWPLTAP